MKLITVCLFFFFSSYDLCSAQDMFADYFWKLHVKGNVIYYSVENNTIGEAALISIAEYGEENIPGYFLSDNSGSNNAIGIHYWHVL
jgi:hypothetical protein